MIDSGEADGLLLVAVVDMSPGDPARGKQYEDAVLALLPRHGGTLQQRLHSTDARSEVHVIRFESRAGYNTFMSDPDRLSLRASFAEAAPTTRVIEVAEPHI
ncbi:hypothetical protein [Paractinoplanes brasiliensis]|uniref:Antibiotic biosynthesis monooxygenase n=1 Tax=Paractinoplanes brasiliensis TaxID=52695 RepID=A0A4R6JVE2_9ACTN|nr:hypothetical protein [Actinoplanes brasiliensis]TDO38625.1 hypothetical protein C8E87_2284 [Actinoplanes brasiliensis]GID26600.1 hypothetical protein Abr02nite_15830 [Actinoplanes brasiliensis]